MHCQTPEQSREENITYHLVPEQVWSERGQWAEYVPEAFDADGFIHCTNGLEPLVDVANMFYRADDRDYIVLVLNLALVHSEVRYDDPDQKFPHIYGPLSKSAVIGRLTARRKDDGTFMGFASRA